MSEQNRLATSDLNGTILEQIVRQRQQRISALYQRYDVAALQAQLRPSERSLADALAQTGSRFILECKKASPSKGLIREDFNPVALARSYAPYAAAISVLTEPDFFQGQFDYLTAVSAAVTQPILCKDFIIDPLQIYLARYYGADAVLLMLSVLDDERYQQLASIAADLQLDILTEVSNEQEMARASRLRANIIGINNRDLRDLSIDIQRSEQLSKKAPKGALLIAESGYQNNQQVRTSAPYVDGFLIGSALAAQDDIDWACRALLYGEHKVCGITQAATAHVAQALGACYGGLIFAKPSPRHVTLEQARSILNAEPKLRWVGVFNSGAADEVIETAQQLALHAVQLHGDWSADSFVQIKRQLPQVAIWRALAVTAPPQLTQPEVDRYLLDNAAGGSGRCFDWQHLRTLTNSDKQRCQLAGGLNLGNIDSALAHHCVGVDVNSGVERQTAEKDAGMLSQFFARIRQYGREDL